MDTAITFGLPEEDTRRQIMHNYATHLTDDELKELASMTGGLSGRDMRDLAEQTERRWASKVGCKLGVSGSCTGRGFVALRTTAWLC